MTRYLPVLFLVALDQVSKLLIRNSFELYESISLLPVLALTYTTNTGIAFGLFEGYNFFFILVTVAVLSVVVTSAGKIQRDFGKAGVIALYLIVSGGIGNLIDRVFFGTVTDFIDLRWKGQNVWPVFNLADSYVFIGAWILGIKYLLGVFKRRSCGQYS